MDVATRRNFYSNDIFDERTVDEQLRPSSSVNHPVQTETGRATEREGGGASEWDSTNRRIGAGRRMSDEGAKENEE